jgi:hypothetical protein
MQEAIKTNEERERKTREDTERRKRLGVQVVLDTILAPGHVEGSDTQRYLCLLEEPRSHFEIHVDL